MGFQALFKFVKCWRAPDIVRETVPSSRGCDGERALAEFQTSARDRVPWAADRSEDRGRIEATRTVAAVHISCPERCWFD